MVARRKGLRASTLRKFVTAGNERSAIEAWADLKSEYRMTQPNRFRSVALGGNAVGVDADLHCRNDADYYRMMEYARHIEMNDRLVGPCLRRLCTNVLRKGGLQLNPQTGSKELDQLLKAKHTVWATDATLCDSRQRDTFRVQARNSLRRIIVDGDIFPILRTEGFIQNVEGHRVRSPRTINNQRRNKPVIHGVEIDPDTAAALRFYFTKTNVPLNQPIQRVSETVPRPAFHPNGERSVLHCYFPERFSQTRGVTLFNRFADDSSQTDDVLFAWLVREQVASCITFVEETDPNVPPRDDDDDELGDWRHQALDGGEEDEVTMKPGKILRPRAGKQYKPFGPNLPGDNSMAHAMLHVAIMAVNLGVPVQVLMLDPEKSTFSGWKGATNEAQELWHEIGGDLADGYHSPIYRRNVARWLEEDPRAAALANQPGVNPYAHTWHPQQKDSIQPVEDATADEIRLKGCHTSPRRFQQQRFGREWSDIYTEIIDDNGDAIEEAIKRAIKINTSLKPDPPVQWRDLLPLSLAEGMKISIQTGAAQDATANSQGATE